MSHAATEWVKTHEHTITGAYRLVLLEVADCVRKNEGGWGWATVKRIRTRANVSADTYKKAIIRLREAGLIEVDVNGGANQRHADESVQGELPHGRRANGYYLVPLLDDERLDEWEALKARNSTKRSKIKAGTAAHKAAKKAAANALSGSAADALGADGSGVHRAHSHPVHRAHSHPVHRAHSPIEEDPLLDPLPDPKSSSELTQTAPATPADDDDQSLGSEPNDLDATVAAVIDQLAQHDLTAATNAGVQIYAPEAWLTAARNNRMTADGTAIGSAVAGGERSVAVLVAAVLNRADPVQLRRTGSDQRNTTVPHDQSQIPEIVAERRRIAAVPDLPNEPHLTREQSQARIRQAKEQLRK